MGTPRYEVLSGAIDGVNTTFFTSVAYTPGSLAVFINGQLKRADYDDGWIETSPETGEVTLREAPKPYPLDHDEVVQAFFIDTIPVDVSFIELIGILEEVDEITGVLTEETVQLVGVFDEPDQLVGTLTSDQPLAGQVKHVLEINGQLCVC